ncbi:MAG: YqaA family protein [Pseudomonadota bacterium]
MRVFQPIYDRVLKWSRHPHAERYLFGMSLAEATFFPVPPDVMLAPMVLANRAKAWRLALLTTIASVLGGTIGYLIGWLAFEAVFPLIERIGYAGTFQTAVQAFEQYGLWLVVVVGFTPIPYKIITIAAGMLLMPLPLFILASVMGRGARFFLVAALIYIGGEHMQAHLRRWIDTIGWAVVVIALVAAVVIGLH